MSNLLAKASRRCASITARIPALFCPKGPRSDCLAVWWGQAIAAAGHRPGKDLGSGVGVLEMVKTEPFDAARYLTSPESQAELLNDALASGEASYVAHA